MTKIRDMARITPFRKATKMTPPSKSATRRGNPNNPGFKQYLETRHSEQLSLQDLILVALEEIHQPVSTGEMQAYLRAEGGIDIKDYRVKYALDQLVTSGKAAMHLEDEAERTLRANGVPTTPRPAHLYNSGSAPRHRTVAVVVEGYSLFDPRTLKGRPKKKTAAKAKAVATRQAAPTPPVTEQANAIDYLIEKIVAERTRDLQAQLDEANQKLEQFRKLLS